MTVERIEGASYGVTSQPLCSWPWEEMLPIGDRLGLAGGVGGAIESPSPTRHPDVATGGSNTLDSKRRRCRTLGEAHWKEKAAQETEMSGAPRNVEDMIREMSASQRTTARDAWVRMMLERLEPHAPNAGSNQEKRTWLNNYWDKDMDSAARLGYLKRLLQPAMYPQPPQMPDLQEVAAAIRSKYAELDPVVYDTNIARRSALATQEAAARAAKKLEFDEAAPHRDHCYTLCWQGKWAHFESDVVAIVEAKLQGEAKVTAVKRAPTFLWLWEEFKVFAKGRAADMAWPKRNYKMELTLNVKDARNVVHFHLCVSDPTRKHRLRDGADFWEFLGSKPVIFPTKCTARSMDTSIAAAHYYCQTPKIGSLFAASNSVCFKDCPLEPKFVFTLWKRYKMEDEVAMREIR